MPGLFGFSLLCSTIFLGLLILTHVLKNDLKFKKDALSRYAIGRYGWVITLGLYSIGLAEIFLSFGLAYTNHFLAGYFLLTAAGIGAFIVSFFKMEHPVRTVRGHLHRLGAGVQFFFFPLALLLLSDTFIGSNLYSFTLSIATANFLLVVAILFFFLTRQVHLSPYFGLVQKTNIFLMTLWVMVVSLAFMLET